MRGTIYAIICDVASGIAHCVALVKQGSPHPLWLLQADSRLCWLMEPCVLVIGSAHRADLYCGLGGVVVWGVNVGLVSNVVGLLAELMPNSSGQFRYCRSRVGLLSTWVELVSN